MQKIFPKLENDRIEFKLKFCKEIIETIVAFSNSLGGNIYLGIDDHANVLGVDIGKESLSEWYNQIKQSTEPSVLVDFEICELENLKKVVIIKVSEFPIKPVSTKGRAYKRIKNSNHLLSSYESSELYLLTYQRSWDSYPSNNLQSISELDESIFKQFLDESKEVDRFKIPTNFSEALKKLKLIKNDKPTNASEILFTNDHLYFIRAGKFKDAQKILDDKQFSGNILDQLDAVFKYIIDKIEVSYEIVPGQLQRIEHWQYPLDVIREILVNAIVHRNYQLANDIQIKIFPQKITFFNPGCFYSGITIDDIKTDDYQSRSRNLLISEIFYLAGKIEKYGSGFIRIRKSLENYPDVLFKIEESGDGVLVTLVNSSGGKELSSGGNELSSGGNELSSGGKSIAKVQNSKRISVAVMKSAIVELCQQPKTLSEIATILKRDKDFIRSSYLTKMLSEGIIELMFPDRPNHPEQAYRIKK